METFGQYVGVRWKYFLNHKTMRSDPVGTIYRVLKWMLHCAFNVPAVAKLKRWNVSMYLPAKLRRVGSTMIYIARENYEPELLYLERFLKPGGVFVDGGANIGVYTVVASSLVGDSGKVYAFEPADESYLLLDKNIKINNQNNVKMYQLALSDKVGETKLHHIDNAPTSYSLGTDEHSSDSYEVIKTTTLDLIAENDNIDRVDVIKLDVEGAEELVLRGASTVLEKHKPVVIFEIREVAAERLGLDTFGAWEFLKQYGYKLFRINKETGETIGVDDPDSSGNYIAMHE